MIRSDQSRYTDKSRGLYIELIMHSEVSDAKAETALYRLVGDSKFKEQAIKNVFTEDSLHLVRKVNIIEYVPRMSFGGYTVYKHKGNGNLHIALKKEDCPRVFAEEEADKFRVLFAPTYRMGVINNSITFDDYQTKLMFDRITGLRK
jgi:hypothetical protein